MDKANEIITNIIKEVLTALYQPFGAVVLMAFVSMFVFLYAREHGWKKGSLIKNIFAHGLEILRKALHLEGLSFWCFILQ